MILLCNPQLCIREDPTEPVKDLSKPEAMLQVDGAPKEGNEAVSSDITVGNGSLHDCSL